MAQIDQVLEEVRKDIFEHPKSSINLDYLNSVRSEIQKHADETNSQLKKNVYQNYSLFIESSREIATLKEEMRQLNNLLEQQQASMNRLLDQINKTPIIQPNLDRSEPKSDIFGNLNSAGNTDEDQTDSMPEWFVKSPEDFDVLIAQRNLKEAVTLVKRIKEHYIEYPKCCEGQQHNELKIKIDSRIKDLINVISSELQPAVDRPIQGGPRSSINAIQLLRDLNLTSRAVKLYLDLRTSTLRSVLSNQKIKSTAELITIFSHNMMETCNEFRQAFDLQRSIDRAIDECNLTAPDFKAMIDTNNTDSERLLIDLVRPIYLTERKRVDRISAITNGNDISAEILSPHGVKVVEDTLLAGQNINSYQTFYHLSIYASLTYWITLELKNFAVIFKKHVFNYTPPLSLTKVADNIYSLRKQCAAMSKYCEIDMVPHIDRELNYEIERVINDCTKNLIDKIKELDAIEQWQPQEFRNKTDKTRFLAEMSDVDLKTMPKYTTEDLKCHFTSSKTAFARYFLITVNDLAKVGVT